MNKVKTKLDFYLNQANSIIEHPEKFKKEDVNKTIESLTKNMQKAKELELNESKGFKIFKKSSKEMVPSSSTINDKINNLSKILIEKDHISEMDSKENKVKELESISKQITLYELEVKHQRAEISKQEKQLQDPKLIGAKRALIELSLQKDLKILNKDLEILKLRIDKRDKMREELGEV